jgi:hypothetical protein
MIKVLWTTKRAILACPNPEGAADGITVRAYDRHHCRVSHPVPPHAPPAAAALQRAADGGTSRQKLLETSDSQAVAFTLRNEGW